MTQNKRGDGVVFRFLFVGGERDWKPLSGSEAPSSAKMTEVRALPGNIVAGGKDWADAVAKLRGALERAFQRAGSVEAWYRSARESMATEDKDDLEYFLNKYFNTSSEPWFQENGYQWTPLSDDVGGEECHNDGGMVASGSH